MVCKGEGKDRLITLEQNEAQSGRNKQERGYRCSKSGKPILNIQIKIKKNKKESHRVVVHQVLRISGFLFNSCSTYDHSHSWMYANDFSPSYCGYLPLPTVVTFLAVDLCPL